MVSFCHLSFVLWKLWFSFSYRVVNSTVVYLGFWYTTVTIRSFCFSEFNFDGVLLFLSLIFKGYTRFEFNFDGFILSLGFDLLSNICCCPGSIITGCLQMLVYTSDIHESLQSVHFTSTSVHSYWLYRTQKCCTLSYLRGDLLGTTLIKQLISFLWYLFIF